MIDWLYDNPLVLRNGDVVLRPCLPRKPGYVQYRCRMPQDLSRSVHYEVYAETERVHNEEKTVGCRVALHTEEQTLEGNKNSRRKLVRFLKKRIKEKREFRNGRFSLGKAYAAIDLKNKDIVPADIPSEQFVSVITDLMSELYSLVEDLLVEAERDRDLNPWGYDDDEDEKKNQEDEPELHEQVIVSPADDEECWKSDSNVSLVSVTRLMKMKLRIPDYQRPYKWSNENVLELLKDIEDAIRQSELPTGAKRYRLGTVILLKDENAGDGFYSVVDGQQRITTLALLRYCLTQEECGPLLSDHASLEHFNRSSVSRANLSGNYQVIKSFFAQSGALKTRFFRAMDELLEVVLVRVGEESEAFQLFDSQNTRGRALAPHDLLKAHHLRAMVDDGATERQMKRRVTGWESVNPKLISELFNFYLFRVFNWSRRERTHWFSTRDIGVFKGLSPRSNYSFVRRIVAAGHKFQVGSDFPAGDGFFALVDHYLDLLDDVRHFQDLAGGQTHQGRIAMKRVMRVVNYPGTAWGIRYIKELFLCALFCFCDRFGAENLDARVVSTLCKWAYSLVVDLDRISEGSVNRYAIGMDGYTNALPMFSIIREAKSPLEIVSKNIKISESLNQNVLGLRERLKKLGE